MYNYQKHSKSLSDLCKHSKTDMFCIIFYSNHHRNCTKYEVSNIISTILMECLRKDETSVQLEEPPHGFYIQADVMSLQYFLHSLQDNDTENEPKKLIIRNRFIYPVGGFPNTLETLRINHTDRCLLDMDISYLTKLKILDLSNNCIEFLPVEFCNLPNLCELNLSHNSFGRGSPKQWMWMNAMLSKNLRLLNLSHNELVFLPNNIIKLYNLVTLNIDHNQLNSLPSGIGNLSNLKTVTASHNFLYSLPGCVKKWKLENIDLSHNNFHMRQPNASAPVVLSKVCSLKEYSARAVLLNRLPYTFETLPRALIHYLESAKYCTCGKACFSVRIPYVDTLYLSSIAKNYNYYSDATIRVFIQIPMRVTVDYYFCSVRCFIDNKKRALFQRGLKRISWITAGA